MSSAVSDLLSILDLEQLDINLFRGRSPQVGWQRVFGGQVIGQALVAAQRTVVEDRYVHSLHCYFMRPGDPATPIIYEVDRIRDGSSFTTGYPQDYSETLINKLEEANVPFEVKGIPGSPWWSSLIWLAPFVLFIVFWIYLMNRMQGGGSKVMSLNSLNIRTIEPTTTSATMDMVTTSRGRMVAA